jgi:di/tricarboxylate transporter
LPILPLYSITSTDMIDFQVVLVLAVLLWIIISLYFEIVRPVITFLIAVIVFGLTGILTPREILKGFANEQVAVVLLLLLIGDIIRKTQVIHLLFDRIFTNSLSYRGFMGRMMSLIAVFSAFLNNTPLVAVMMPYLHSWSRGKNIYPSKLLIPLSYAAILGGCATLIGTSTNLIVNSLWVDQTLYPNAVSLHIFDFFLVGGPMVLVGLLFLYLFGNRLLPERGDIITKFSENTREYVLEVQIRKNSSLIGQTVIESGLTADNDQGHYLVEIIRGSYNIRPVTADVVLEAEDILVFSGDNEAVADLVNSERGLYIPEVRRYSKRERMEVVEIVISHNSLLINKTIRDVNFSRKYDASVLAIHRNGERISGSVKEVRLKAGDVLLLLAGPDLNQRGTETQDFYFISMVREINKFEPYKIAVMIGGVAASILLSALNIVPLFLSLVTLVVVLVFLKVATPRDIAGGVDYNLYLIISLSLALGTAMINTGTADIISGAFITLFKPLGKVGILFGIYLITALLAAFITNKAAVAIIFPISLATAMELGAPPLPFVLVVSFAAAANFMTPIGYQTNLMVYGPGEYKFRDFLKIGSPLTVLYMIVTVTILSIFYL